MQPKKPPEETECQLCQKQITSKYSWQVRISYCNGGKFYKKKACRDCVAKLTGMPTDRMRFEECLREYRMEFRISMYHNEHIDRRHLLALKARLDYKKIPIRNYGIPLYYLEWKPQYLHKLLKKIEPLSDYEELTRICDRIKD